MSTTKNAVNNAAMEYKMRGFSVIPLRSNDKRPTISSWQPYQSKKADWDEIDRWFQVPKNIGIVTGAISGIVVLDIDGPEGAEALEAITNRFGSLPQTWCSTTGKGRHYLFLHPGVELKNMANRLLGIDIRGDGGYIVAPPSIHPSGAQYTWVHDSDAQIQPAPGWLMEWMQSERDPLWIGEILHQLGRIESIKVDKIGRNEDGRKEDLKNLHHAKTKAAPAKIILDNCAFVQHCKKNCTTLSEPEWHAMITNVARADGGIELAHELSRPYPGYEEQATDDKIERALNDGEPHTCEYIQNRIGFRGCPPDGCGVKAPVVFATSEIASAQAIINQLVEQFQQSDNPQASSVFASDVIDALATLRRKDIAAYTVIKTDIKAACKIISLRDLDSIVKVRQDEQVKERVAERISLASQINAEIAVKVDFGFQITIPPGWALSNEGVQLISADDQKRIMPVLLYLTKRIHNADTAEEKVQLSYYRDSEWKQINVARPVAFSRSAITTLSAHALPVTSENAKDVINYLSDFEAANLETIPVIKSVGRMGWIGQHEFLPGAAGSVELDVEPGMGSIASGYTTSGTLNEWTICMKEARRSSMVRMLMAASFAAPLLKLVGHRVFLVHIWGPSRGGKTAALKAALSVWGEPETIMASFNSTRVGLERLAGFYCDLPLGVDERQLVGNKQDLIESLVYLIGMGKGKTRGNKGGGIQAAQSWRTIALTTGEEPLSGESSNTGIRTRVIELYGEPFDDERKAAAVHQATKDHYGHAGVHFIEQVIKLNQETPEAFKSAHQLLSDDLVKKYPLHMGATISQFAMLALGDLFSSVLLFDIEFNRAVKEAVDLIDQFASQILTREMADESVVAAQKLQSWCISHHENFSEKTMLQFGYKKEGAFYILSHKFDEIMRELNFNSQRMLRDWSRAGWIKTEKDGDRIRYRIRHWDNELRQRVDCIVFYGPYKDERNEANSIPTDLN